MSVDFKNLLATLSTSSKWSDGNERAILEPYTYISSSPGKGVRGELIEAFNVWLKVPAEKLKIIATVVSMFHNASLMFDDIEDDSQLRRGNPVTHKIYGIPQTINTANYVVFRAYRELAKLRIPEEVPESPLSGERRSPTQRIAEKNLDLVVTDELLALHRGQGLDILWRDTLKCPTEAEYISMVQDKTGGLFRIAIKLMMACSTENNDVWAPISRAALGVGLIADTRSDYVPLVNLIGVYFQIRDDYMNLKSGQYTNNKGFAEDLTEGKFSFPVVHSIRADPSNRQILSVLQKRPATPSLKVHAIEYLERHTHSFEYTLDVMRILEKQAYEEVKRMGGNKGLEAILDSLHVPDSEQES